MQKQHKMFFKLTIKNEKVVIFYFLCLLNSTCGLGFKVLLVDYQQWTTTSNIKSFSLEN